MKTFITTLLLASTALALPKPFTPSTRLPQIKPAPLRRANQIIPVVVGGPQDTFVPNSVVAAMGDIIQFQFSNGNHTVTQSTMEAACAPMDGGVHSGHIPFEDGQTEVGTFNMPVTSTEAMYLYCATGPHCQRGQVMVINGNAAQVAEYTKASQMTTESVDGSDVIGGTAGTIGLDAAAFVPAPPEEGEAPPPPPAEEVPAEEAPAEEAPAEEAPAEEAPAEEAPAEEAPAEEAPAEETPAEEAPAEEAPAEEAPAEEAPAEETPAEEAPAEEVPAEGEAPAEETPADEAPANEAPAEEAPAEEAPAEEAPAEEAPAEAEAPAAK